MPRCGLVPHDRLSRDLLPSGHHRARKEENTQRAEGVDSFGLKKAQF